MNFIQIQRHVWWSRGRTDEANLQDYERQQIRDQANMALDEIVDAMKPYYWRHLEVSSFATSSGGSPYTLADDCLRPISFWTQDTRARIIPFVDPVSMDMSGERNSNLTTSFAGNITWYPETTTAGSSGAAGASAGVSVSNAATTVTKSGGTAFASADVGKFIRLNGEFDFTIASVTNDNELEISRAYRGRLSGDAQDNSPSGLTQVAWEISPPGRYRVEIPPDVSNAETLYYRYARHHTPLLNDTDVPDIQVDKHRLISWGTTLLNMADREKQDQTITGKYHAGLAAMQRENIASIGSEIRTYYEANSQMANLNGPYPVDIDFRTRMPGRRL